MEGDPVADEFLGTDLVCVFDRCPISLVRVGGPFGYDDDSRRFGPTEAFDSPLAVVEEQDDVLYPRIHEETAHDCGEHAEELKFRFGADLPVGKHLGFAFRVKLVCSCFAMGRSPEKSCGSRRSGEGGPGLSSHGIMLPVF